MKAERRLRGDRGESLIEAIAAPLGLLIGIASLTTPVAALHIFASNDGADPHKITTCVRGYSTTHRTSLKEAKRLADFNQREMTADQQVLDEEAQSDVVPWQGDRINGPGEVACLGEQGTLYLTTGGAILRRKLEK